MQTKEDLFKKINESAQWNVGVVIARKEALPLDMTSTFKSFEEAQTYASTSKVAYIGQIVSVIEDPAADAPEGSVGDVKYYYIDQSMQLQELGKSVVADDATIELKDGKLQLVGFENAQAAQLPRRSADGKLEWVSVDAVVEGATRDTITTGDAKSIASKATTELDDTGASYAIGYTLSINGFEDAADGLVPVKSGETIAWQDVYTTAEVDTKVSEINASLETVNSELDVLEGEIDGVAGRVATAESEIDVLESELAVVESTVGEHTTALTTVNSELDVLEGEIDGVAGRVETAESEIDALEGEIESINNKISSVFSYKGIAESISDDATTIVINGQSVVASEDNVGFVYLIPEAELGEGSELDVTYEEYVSNGSRWELLGHTIDLSGYYTAAQVDQKVATINSELDVLEGEIDAVAATVGEHTTALEGVNSELDAIEDRFASYYTSAQVDTKVSEINVSIEAVEDRFASYYTSAQVDQTVATINSELDVLEGEIDGVAGRVETAESEIDVLESELGVVEGSLSEVSATVGEHTTALEAVNSELDVIENRFASYYTSAQVDTKVSEINVAIKAVDDRFASYYTSEQVDQTVATINSEIDVLEAEFANYYTKSETDATVEDLNTSINTAQTAANNAQSTANTALTLAKASAQIQVVVVENELDASGDEDQSITIGNPFGVDATATVYYNGQYVIPQIDINETNVILTFAAGSGVFEPNSLRVVIVGETAEENA